MPRPIDATRLVKLVLEERDKIPLEVVERYSFGVPSPNKHGQSMRGGIRKVLRLIEQAPTLDYAPVRHGEWIEHVWAEEIDDCLVSNYECTVCYEWEREKTDYCPNCGAKMDAKEDER